MNLLLFYIFPPFSSETLNFCNLHFFLIIMGITGNMVGSCRSVCDIFTSGQNAAISIKTFCLEKTLLVEMMF
jgi:hypothetical protein